MERILKILGREYGNVNQAALLLGFFAFLSQILGLFRDRAIAHFVGPSALLDAYYTAFRIPDLIFISIASLASITVLIPFLSARMSGSDVTETAQKFLNEVFTVFVFGLTTFSLLVFFLMPVLVPLIAPGFDAELQNEVINLSRIMLLSPIFLGLSNLFGAVTQLFRKFFIFSLSPIFYNLGIIFGVTVLYQIFGIKGMALGVVLGAFMHLVVQIISAGTCGFVPRFTHRISWSDIRQVVSVSLPRTLGLSLNSFALIAIIAYASFLQSGSISVFNFSYNIQSVPLNIIGISYAVAAFPILVKSLSQGLMGEFKEHLKNAGRQIIFWSLPVMFLFIVLRAQIVRVILGSPTFSWEETRLVAASLAVFAISIMAQGLVALFARAYYAGGNTRRPLAINLISSFSIIIFVSVFLHIFQNYPFFRYLIESGLKVSDIPGTEVLMLPLAYSCGTILNMILLALSVKWDFMRSESFLTKTFFQSLAGSFAMGVVAYIGLNILSPVFGTATFWGVFLQGFISGIVGIIAGIGVLHLLGSEELKDLIKTFHTKFWKTKVIAPTQEGV